MENVCNAIFEEPAIVDREKRGEYRGTLLMGWWVEGVWYGAYQRGINASRSVLGIGSPLPRLLRTVPSSFGRMFLSRFLPFVLVSFAYAQLMVQDSTELDQGMVSAMDSGIDRPGHIPLDVENYPVAPSTLQLEQVHLFVRHGAFG